MGQKSEVISDLFEYGIPYISEADGNTPLNRAVKMNDRNVINSILSHFGHDTNELGFNDLKLIIQKFQCTWKNNFSFMPSQFTIGASE